MKAYYTIEVRDKKGRITKFTRLSRSYVRQWNDIIYSRLGATNQSAKDTSGATVTIDWDAVGSQIFKANAGVTAATWGIQAGTDPTAVAIDDYALGAAIAEGTGSGQMQHAAMVFTAPTVSGSGCSFTAQRVITNNSGSTITVKEVGLVVSQYVTPAANKFFLVLRDVITDTDVPNAGSITITYTVKVLV